MWYCLRSLMLLLPVLAQQPKEPILLDAAVLDGMNSIIVASKPSWEILKKMYSSSSKELLLNVPKLGEISVVNLLLYIRAFSRVLVDGCVSAVRQSGARVWALAQGSTLVTSDYDVNVFGNGAVAAARCVAESFTRGFISHPRLADVADTNVYVAPGFALLEGTPPTNRPLPSWLKVVKVRTLEDGWVLAYPLPSGEVAFRLERARLKEKFLRVVADDGGRHQDDGVTPEQRFGKVIEAAGRLEAFYYQKEGAQVQLDEESYWKLVLEALSNQEEAYVAVSTVLVVVEYLQGKNLELKELLMPESWKIAAAENYCDLSEHGGLRPTDFSDALRTSKYAYRSFVALREGWPDAGGGGSSVDWSNAFRAVSEVFSVRQGGAEMSSDATTASLMVAYSKALELLRTEGRSFFQEFLAAPPLEDLLSL